MRKIIRAEILLFLLLFLCVIQKITKIENKFKPFDESNLCERKSPNQQIFKSRIQLWKSKKKKRK
jgi:Na+-transporting methylmalonyl-CoA/oxaloacetate decarboxylase gamma subunit